MQKFCRFSSTCKNLAIYLLFARICQDICYLEDFCQIFNTCNNSSRNLILAEISLKIFYLQKSREISYFCRDCARCPLLAKKSKENVYLMHELCKIFVISKKLAGYLMIGGIFQDIKQMQKPLKESNTCRSLARYILLARSLPGIDFF